MRIAVVGGVRLTPLREWLGSDAAQALSLVPDSSNAAPATPIVTELLRRGHSVVVVALHSAVTDDLRLKSSSGLTLRLGRYRPRYRARDLFRAERAYISSVLTQEAPDVVHAQWTYENALGALATGLPTLVTIRDWAPTMLRLRPDPYRAARLLMNVHTLARGQYFTASSPYMAARLERWRRKPLKVIPNVLDDQALEAGPIPIRSGPLTVVALNNGFDRKKNVATLLSAFSRVRAAHPDCRLRLIGPGYGPAGPAEQWARSRGLTDGVLFQGPVKPASIFEALRSADLFVHPSLEESFGTALIEAGAQGLPTVAGRDSGAVPWVLDYGRAGLLTDVRSSDALASTIMGLLGDEAARRRYGTAGYMNVRRRFSASRAVDDYLESYSFVVAGPAR